MKLKKAGCERCGECCGHIMCSGKEFRAVMEFVKTNKISTGSDKTHCPFLAINSVGTHYCLIYRVRPLPCQQFGHVPQLRCPNGHNRFMTPRQAAAIKTLYGREITATGHRNFLGFYNWKAGKFIGV